VERPDDVARQIDTPSTHDAEAWAGPSKSQRKRDAHMLQALGAQLVTLPPACLKELDLPEELREAIYAAQGMRQRGARKRQVQYIGKLLRQLDPAPLRTALEALKTARAGAKRHQQSLDRLSRALLAGEEPKEDFATEPPCANLW
jgi:ribosome-associated protein